MSIVDGRVEGGPVRGVARRAATSGPPSFHRRCLEMQQRYRRQVEAGQVDTVFAWTRDRVVRRRMLAGLGVRTAALWHETTADGLTAGMLAEPCVVKNAGGASAIGVYILDPPDEDGRWLNVRTGHRRSLDEIKAGMRETLRQYPHWPDRWHIEERMLPPDGRATITEYQVFVFGAYSGSPVVPLVRIYRAENGRTHRGWVNERWQPVEDTGLPVSGTVDLPDDPAGVHAVAVRVASAIPLPFVRVDVWETIAGLAVGEVNDHYGGTERFWPGWDRYLGMLWDLAEQEMEVSTVERMRVEEPAPPPQDEDRPVPRMVAEPAPPPGGARRKRGGRR